MKDTDVAQGVEQIVYEVLLEMGKEGLITGKSPIKIDLLIQPKKAKRKKSSWFRMVKRKTLVRIINLIFVRK